MHQVLTTEPHSMEIVAVEKIKSLQSCTFLKAEYQCEQCSYMICRSITKPEIELMLKENRIIEPLYCPTCDTESVQLIEVYSEEDWYRRYPDYMQGG